MSEVIDIWSDVDVQRISDFRDGRPWPRFHIFNDDPFQLQLITDFVEADQRAGSDGPADAFLAACLAGIRAVEELPTDLDLGWRKFLVFMVDSNNYFLWELHRREEVAAIAEWTVETIGRYGWGPDGNSTALGQRHSSAMALAAMAGGGLRTDPTTGKYTYGTGDAARLLAGVADRGRGQDSVRSATEPPAPPPDLAGDLVAQLKARSEAAEAGDRASQAFLAAVAARIEGEDANAIKLFEEAARLGDAQAMIEIADIYETAGDPGSAKAWFESAIGAGSAEAFGRIAQLAEAAGDEVGEREWTRTGAEAGDGWCMGNWAYFRFLDAQEASDQDRGPILNETYTYAVQAAKLGNVNAMYSAGIVSTVLGREREGLEWLLRAEQGGHTNARAMINKLDLK